MSSMKPGMWAATPAHVDSDYANFWNGLVFCAPLWERSGPPIDLITRTFGVITGTPTMVNTTTGIAARGSNTAGWLWAAHETHDRIPAADAWTFILLVQRYGNYNGGLIFGYGIDTDWTPGDAAGMIGDTAERLRQAVGPDLLSPTGNFAADVQELHIVRWDGAEGEAYRYGLDGQLAGSTIAAATTNVSTGGQIGLSDSADDTPRIRNDYLVAYAWDRHITDAEIRLLLDDPYGPIRPAPIFGGLTVTLYATGDGTISTLEDEGGATTDLWQSIDDDPATPTDADWINNINELSGGDASGFFDLTNTPADFGNADGASIVVRVAGNDVAATHKLYVQLFKSDETTTISDEVELLSVSAPSGQTNYAGTITGVSTTATKAEWDAARIKLRWSVT